MSIPSLRTLCLETVVAMEKPKDWQKTWHSVIPQSLVNSLIDGHHVTVTKKKMGFLFDLKNAQKKTSPDYLNKMTTICVSTSFWVPHDATISDLKKRILFAYRPIYQKIGLQASEVNQKKQSFKIANKSISQCDDAQPLSNFMFIEPSKSLSVVVGTYL